MVNRLQLNGLIRRFAGIRLLVAALMVVVAIAVSAAGTAPAMSAPALGFHPAPTNVLASVGGDGGVADLGGVLPQSAITDGSFGYFTVGWPDESVQLVKVRLSDMAQVDAATIAGPEQGPLSVAVTDGTFGYFGSDTFPGRVVKVRLSDLSVVDAIELTAEDGGLEVAVTDGTFGYFGTRSAYSGELESRVVKVRLSDMTRVGVITFNPDEVYLGAALADGTFGYFGTDTFPGTDPSRGRVVKVRLSDMTRVGAVTLNPGEGFLGSAVTDGTFGYFGTDTFPARVVKVRLSDMTRVGATEPDSDADYLRVAVTDGVFGYFGTLSGSVIKLRLSDMTRVDSVKLTAAEGRLLVAVTDGTFGYFGTLGLDDFRGGPVVEQASVVKVRLSTLDRGDGVASERISSLRLDGGANSISAAITDGTFGYFGTYTEPGRIVKVRLADMTRVGTVTLNSRQPYVENRVTSAVTDGTFGYFGTLTGQVVKVRLSDMARVATLQINVDLLGARYSVDSAVTDGTFGYFATSESLAGLPERVVKVRLADLAVVGAVTIASGSDLVLAVSDGVFGYFGTLSFPGRVVKLRLSDLTQVGVFVMGDGDGYVRSAVTDGTFGYFGTGQILSDQGRVLKVRLSDLARVDELRLQSGEGVPTSAVIVDGFGYFGTDSSPGRVVKVRLSDMSRVAAVPLAGEEAGLFAAVSDGDFGFFATNTSPGRVVKVRLAPPGQGVPSGLVVTPGVGELAVSWSAPDAAGGPPVTGYIVTVTPGGATCATVAPSTSCVVSGLSETGQYRVRVTASTNERSSLSPVVTPGAGSPAPAFVDVPQGSFFAQATSMLKSRGITAGTNATGDEYAPEGQVSRQQMALFLWRMAGSPGGPVSCGFADERSIAAPARQAACWLKTTKVTTNNPFNPLGVVNRQQMAAFLWRFAGEPVSSGSCGFGDESQIASFARVPACWLRSTGITTNDPYQPTGQVTRAQMAAFLYRLGAVQGLWARSDN